MMRSRVVPPTSTPLMSSAPEPPDWVILTRAPVAVPEGAAEKVNGSGVVVQVPDSIAVSKPTATLGHSPLDDHSQIFPRCGATHLEDVDGQLGSRGYERIVWYSQCPDLGTIVHLRIWCGRIDAHSPN